MDELTLHRYLDGRLDERQRSAVEETLRSDPTARRTLNALREEARLIGGALESLSEPSRRISDKVIAQLHLEERSRVASARTRKLFVRLGQAVAFAALLMVCLYLVKPRSEAGSISSGTNATVVVNGERRDAKKGQRIYDNDGIETGKGQFVRFGLAGGGAIDIDEFSALTMEKSGAAPILRLMRGRIGVSAGAASRGVTIELPQGAVTVQAGSKADIWLPEMESARWPALFYSADLISQLDAPDSPQNAPRPQNEPQPQGSTTPTIVTVFAGSTQLSCAKGASALNAQQGTRVRMTQLELQPRPVNLGGSRVLDMRGDDSIHGRDNLVPAEWPLLGLLDKPQFETLGRRWGLCDGTSPQIAQALVKLDAAMRITAHAERAEKITAAQQALRQACETLPEKDERLRRASTLEGLAHFEEGYARAAAGGTKGSDPRAAFDAARVAFEDALNAGAPATNNAAPNAADWQTAFNAASAPSFSALAPEAQSVLTATFRRATALYWDAILPPALIILDSEEAALDSADRQRMLEESAEAFAKLHESLGHSVEGLAASLGEALCQAQLSIDMGTAGEPARRKALDALALILSKPLANTDGAARQAFDGIRQAALLESVRLHARGTDAQKTLNAAHDFELLYPLDATTSAAKELRALVMKGVEEQKSAALREKRYENAVEACDAWLVLLDEADGHWMDAGQNDSAEGVRHIGARLDLLEALIGAKDWARAAGEAHAMSSAVPAELKPRFDALKAQIKK